MNINQLARNQQMIYHFINKDGGYASQIQMRFSDPDAWSSTKGGTEIDADSLLQKMGMSGLEGRTVREMAKYKLEMQQKAQASQQTQPGSDLSALAQQLSARILYTPISDEATKAMQALALEDAKNSVGSLSSDGLQRITLIQEQLENVAPSKRAAVFSTMNKVWESELDRIGAYIKENDPSWNYWGDPFDTAILEDYQPGINLWV